MSWDFETPAAFAADLEWADRFVAEEIEALDHVVPDAFDTIDPLRAELIPPLQQQVKDRGLWAMHLDRLRRKPGTAASTVDCMAYGQVEFTLLNEILGRSPTAPVVFGCQAPDAGNMEILHQFGTPEQQRDYLQPLLDGTKFSAFSVTEPRGGADPTSCQTVAVPDGGDWVITGEKWFSSNFHNAAFALVLARTHPDAERHERLTMFIVPTATPGAEVVRRVRSAGSERRNHDYVRYDDARVPATAVLGEPGGGFAIMQNRMGYARLALAGRAVGQLRRAFDAMCDRAVSRRSGTGTLGDHQLVQSMIAESWIDIEQYRLLLLRTAWRLDRAANPREVRADIAAVKALMPEVCQRVGTRAAHLHGSLGVSDELPFVDMVGHALALAVADGPTEVHKVTVARESLRTRTPTADFFPALHLPEVRRAARERFADTLARHSGPADVSDQRPR